MNKGFMPFSPLEYNIPRLSLKVVNVAQSFSKHSIVGNLRYFGCFDLSASHQSAPYSVLRIKRTEASAKT